MRLGQDSQTSASEQSLDVGKEPTGGGSMWYNPKGLRSGNSSLDVLMSSMSMYLAPGILGPASNLFQVLLLETWLARALPNPFFA